MRLSIRTKKRRFLLMTGQDVEANDEMTFVQLQSADLSVAPEPEVWVYEEEEDEERTRPTGFGVSPVAQSRR